MSFANGEIRLAGTLALPPGPGPFPAVFLITGSGAQDRDATMFGRPRHRVLDEALLVAGLLGGVSFAAVSGWSFSRRDVP